MINTLEKVRNEAKLNDVKIDENLSSRSTKLYGNLTDQLEKTDKTKVANESVHSNEFEADRWQSSHRPILANDETDSEDK